MKKILPLLFLSIISDFTFAQVGINTTDPKSQLDIVASNQATPSNTDGILIPRIDAFPATPPTIAQNGMLVFLTTASGANAPGFYYWNELTGSWKSTISPAAGWAINGNADTDPSIDFIGTTDDTALSFRLNNEPSGKIETVFAANTFLGYNSGALNNGSGNTGFGNRALGTNITGGGNTAVGDRALTLNDDGGFNTVVGYLAMSSNISGSQNTAMGSEVLISNSTGEGNSGFGYRALSLTQANNNTAIGSGALLRNSYGNNSIAIGASALLEQKFTNGNLPYDINNIAIGVESMSLTNPTATNNGNNNTAIGNFTLHNNLTGANNVALGYQAAYSELGSNKLYIENSNSTTPLIYGEFDNDIVKINGKIQVNTVATNNNEMQVNNTNVYNHDFGSQNFGDGGDYFMMSSKEGGQETGGIYGDGNAITIWSPGDSNRGQAPALVYFVDEDIWDANDNPYDLNVVTALRAYIDPNGNFVQISDKNKKQNIKRISNATEKLNQISGYTYQFKLASTEIAKGDTPANCSGVLAQELEKVLPEAVQKNEAGDYFVNYAAITPLLIEAIKEQDARLNALEAKVEALLKK